MAPIRLIDFRAKTVAGGTIDVAALAGKPAAFWFWAPWCTTCRGLAPDVAALQKEFRGRVEVVGVAGLSSDAASMRNFVESTGIGAFDSVADTDGSVYTRFGITSQDRWVFVAPDGRVSTGVGLGPDEIRSRFAALAA